MVSSQRELNQSGPHRTSMNRKVFICVVVFGILACPSLSARPAQLTGSVIQWGETVLPIVPPQIRFKSIASGYEAQFGLTTDGKLIGWGGNFYHEIPPFGSVSNIVAVSGYTHTLALNSDGTVLAWGDNREGQTAVPPGLSNVVAISA